MSLSADHSLPLPTSIPHSIPELCSQKPNNYSKLSYCIRRNAGGLHTPGPQAGFEGQGRDTGRKTVGWREDLYTLHVAAPAPPQPTPGGQQPGIEHPHPLTLPARVEDSSPEALRTPSGKILKPPLTVVYQFLNEKSSLIKKFPKTEGHSI